MTPFCSCSSIPLFIGFTAAGLPQAVTFSFLISSPLVDLASVILLASIFNWPIALAYVGVGLVLAIVGGTVIGRLRMEDQVAAFVRTVPVSDEATTMTRGERLASLSAMPYPKLPRNLNVSVSRDAPSQFLPDLRLRV